MGAVMALREPKRTAWQDFVRQSAKDYGRVRAQVLGTAALDDRSADKILGALRCTLERVREEREGAGQGFSTQRFPEVYEGAALLVKRATLTMEDRLRLALDLWAAVPGVGTKIKASHYCATYGGGERSYFQAVDDALTYVSGYLAAHDDTVQ